jgi:mannose-6-phosphate isomerase-like protein (cupin superfamily)
MKFVVNVNDMTPDTCDRSLRFAVKGREGQTLRDTYYLVVPKTSPSKNLQMGYTTVYAQGKTTGHSHVQHEEVNFVISGTGRMVIGEDEFEIKVGDALYVPFGVFHTTYNMGVLPLQLLWVTGRDPTIPDK